MTQVRRATEADVVVAADMGERFIGSTPYQQQVAYDHPRAEQFVRWLVSYAQGIMLVLEVDGAPKGMLGAIITDHPFSSTKIALELFWWVEPESRGGGLRLLREFQRWGKSMGADRLNMVSPNERVAHVYERLGFGLVESMYGRAV